MVKAGRNEGLRVAEEAYADRLYEDDGRLASRETADAMITDPERAIRQVVAFIEEGAIVSRSGVKLPARIHTFCVHGDEASGVAVARGLRAALEARGIDVVPLPQMNLS